MWFNNILVPVGRGIIRFSTSPSFPTIFPTSFSISSFWMNKVWKKYRALNHSYSHNVSLPVSVCLRIKKYKRWVQCRGLRVSFHVSYIPKSTRYTDKTRSQLETFLRFHFLLLYLSITLLDFIINHLKKPIFCLIIHYTRATFYWDWQWEGEREKEIKMIIKPSQAEL